MKFHVIAKGIKGLFGRKDQSEDFSAQNAAEARNVVQKKFSRAKEIILYQMLGPGETGDGLAEYSRSWLWELGKEWLRATPGKWMNLSEAPDNASDKELTAKYLASLK